MPAPDGWPYSGYGWDEAAAAGYSAGSGIAPPPGQPFVDPLGGGNHVTPATAYFFSLGRPQQDIVRNANVAMRQAVTDLVMVGIRPEWIFETVSLAMQAGGFWHWDGASWLPGYGPDTHAAAGWLRP